MKLAIVSHTPHYRKDGIVGWGPTVREIDWLALLFDEVIHVAPLHPEQAPASALPYTSNNVIFRGVPLARSKAELLIRSPHYVRAILHAAAWGDVIHVRCPANISLVAIVMLAFLRSPSLRWIKYAGNWRPVQPETSSYRFQRWWLRRGFARSVVTVNGQWPGDPPHIRAFLNPSLNMDELRAGAESSSKKKLNEPVRLLYVGRLEEAKGVSRVLRIVQKLRQGETETTLDLVGDGAEFQKFRKLAEELGIGSAVTFHGWLPRSALPNLYQLAHFVILPSSSSEGWPKVLSDAMAYGAVPIAVVVSSIPQYLEKFGTGKTFPADDLQRFVEAVKSYLQNPQIWKEESERGVEAARQFTYESYLNEVSKLLPLEPSGHFLVNESTSSV
jgi:glycosyltransferase involved in cell wall biosynthesis